MRNESIRPSSAAVTAPAAGPITRAAAVLKVSEIEKLISIDGTRRASIPVVTVSASRATRANDTGPVQICHPEYAAMTTPAQMTVLTRGVARWAPGFAVFRSCGPEPGRTRPLVVIGTPRARFATIFPIPASNRVSCDARLGTDEGSGVGRGDRTAHGGPRPTHGLPSAGRARGNASPPGPSLFALTFRGDQAR